MKKIFIIAIVLNTHYCFSQNVGIGTATPSEALDVNGNINLTGSIKTNGTDGTANQLLGKNNNGSLSWIDMSEFKNFKSFTGNKSKLSN